MLDNSALRSRAHFFPYGLAGQDRILDPSELHGFRKRSPDLPNSTHIQRDEAQAHLYTLETLMSQNGHSHIDILKIDIEGFEFDTLSSIIQSYRERGQPLPFGQLQLEVRALYRIYMS